MKSLEKLFLMKIPLSIFSLIKVEKFLSPAATLHYPLFLPLSLSVSGQILKVSHKRDVKICNESGPKNLTANPMLKS